MRKYSIVLLLLIFGLYDGLVSCNKTGSTENSLVGIWKSTKIDSLAQFIKPARPETFLSVDYKNRVLTINADGSFKMIDSKDTIIGTWNQNKSDSLKVTTSRIHGKYFYDMKIESIDENNLVIGFGYGWFTASKFVGGGTNEEYGQYYIKMYYIRK